MSIFEILFSFNFIVLYLDKISVYLSLGGICIVKNPNVGKIMMIPIITKNKTPDVDYIIKAPMRLPNISADIYKAQKCPK